MYYALSAVGFCVREEWVRGFDGVEVVDCFPQHEIGMTDVWSEAAAIDSRYT